MLLLGFQDIKDKDIVCLYKNRLKKLGHSFPSKNNNTERWHNNRKKIKNLLYFYEVLPKSLLQKLQLNIAYLDRLQNAIGLWHDIFSIEELLRKEGFTDKKMLGKLQKRHSRLRTSIFVLSDDFERKIEAPTKIFAVPMR